MTDEANPKVSNNWDEPRIVVFLIGLCLVIESGLIYYQAGEQQLVVSLVTGISGLSLFLFALLVPLEDVEGEGEPPAAGDGAGKPVDEDRPLLAGLPPESVASGEPVDEDRDGDDARPVGAAAPPPARAASLAASVATPGPADTPSAPTLPAGAAPPPAPAASAEPAAPVAAPSLVASAPPPAAVVAEETKLSWFDRLKMGLQKTRDGFVQKLKRLVMGATTISSDLIDDLEETLYEADVGVDTTRELLANLKQRVADEDIKDAKVIYDILKDALMKKLTTLDATVKLAATGPTVVLIVGVNGVGKTTTIAKLARRFTTEGKKVLLAAGDTFRAAAIDQLCIWGERVGVEVIRGAEGGDPGALVFDAIHAAKKREADLLIIDTAGRLHVKANLMDELKKIRKIVARECEGGPHETLLVVDATTGQNAVQQAKLFHEAIEITGLVMTKLDGTAKGGVLFAVQEQVHAPLKFIGIGEKMDDLRPFVASEFLEALFADDTGKTKVSDYQVR